MTNFAKYFFYCHFFGFFKHYWLRAGPLNLIEGTDMTTLVGNTHEVNAVIGPIETKYFVNIEGNEYEWSKNTITTEEIAKLGGWGDEGVVEIDANNVERTLVPGEVIRLIPGHGFAKKIKWQRGDGVFENRISIELHHLKGHFKEVVQQDNWFLIKDYSLPEGWSLRKADIAFRVLPGYPFTAPYGFFVPTGLRFDGKLPSNYQDVVADVPPFDGQWGMFSWAPVEWKSNDSIVAGHNLLNFALSFAVRFQQGAI